MFATTCKRGLSLFLAVLLCFTAVLGFGTTTAFAAGEQSDVYLVAYPREGDANLDYSGTWGHDNLRYMNGWSSGRSLFTIVRAMGSYKYRSEIPTRAVSSSTVKSDLSRAVLMISPSVSGRFCTVRSPPYIIIWIPFMLILAQPFNYW